MSSAVRVRRYEERDLDEVHALVIRTIRRCYPPHYPPRAVEFFIEHHTRENIAGDGVRAFMVVATAGKRIVGTGTLSSGAVARVFVDPELQGSGVGAAMMNALESEARRFGVDRLTLHASVPAYGFYQRLGYEVLSEGALDVGEGEELRYRLMGKAL
jgi:GNAT superfamily N-acetyltransferase